MQLGAPIDDLLARGFGPFVFIGDHRERVRLMSCGPAGRTSASLFKARGSESSPKTRICCHVSGQCP